MARPGLAKIFKQLTFWGDALALSLALWGAYFLRFSGWPIPVLHDVPSIHWYMQAWPVVLVVVCLSFQYGGLYLPRRNVSGVDEFSRLAQATTAAFLIVLTITFFYRTESYSRVVVFYTWALTIVLASLVRSGLRRIEAHLRRKGVGTARLLLAGLTPTTRLIAENIRRFPDMGYEIVGVISEQEKTGLIPKQRRGLGGESTPTKIGRNSGLKSASGKPVVSLKAPHAEWEGMKLLGNLEQLSEVLERERVDDVILALPATEHHRLESVLMNVNTAKVSMRIASDLFGIITNPLQTDEIYGIPLFAIKESPLSHSWARVLKRALDLVFTLPALVLLSPLLLALALAVKWTSRGPVLYRQERVGRDNQTFTIFKFRTMRMDAEKNTGPVWAVKDDPRRTPIGTFLRKSSLDELPQLFNVVAGNMSLVGPRPERPHFVDQFQKTIPRYLDRHLVKAGLTGWAQVHGLRGNTPVEERVKFDLWYVENWSLWLDVKILIRTALEVFHHTDAY